MELFTENMTEKYTKEILNWKYAKPYDFYNNALSNNAVKEMLENTYYVLVDQQGILIGFYCVGVAAQVPAGNQCGVYQEEQIDIGFGMKPGLTGKGNGSAFLSYILSSIHEGFPGTDIRLSVATFNKRAIHLYGKFGFVKAKEFQTENTNFITMVKQRMGLQEKSEV
ncbi:RimJ/RimL family protein N-acetyltransferase [Virgibacillus halotolerans]|uniref:GNAT family N-acetyltransferase n=1 Tax=Virgibacillus halotolerans TaxID=1071053 RepID=UPI00195F954A|nr:GNAT family N-acetyltransferase [Virgibacillus halotolerans]MBM7600360.1 RimJ/RimL family protein N-acetyltransferase [Virgibacillus halotolerans]